MRLKVGSSVKVNIKGKYGVTDMGSLGRITEIYGDYCMVQFSRLTGKNLRPADIKLPYEIRLKHLSKLDREDYTVRKAKNAPEV